MAGWRCRVGLVVTVVLAAGGGLPVAEAATSATEDETAVVADPFAVPVGASFVEAAEDRLVFRRADGQMVARVFSEPIGWLDDAGAWRPLDTALTAGPDGRVVNGSGPVGVSLAARADDGAVVSLSDGGAVLRAGLEGAAGAAVAVSGSSARYDEVRPGVDLVYELSGEGLKETIVLAEPPSSRDGAVFRFPLELSGLSPREEPDGRVVFVDGEGGVVFEVPVGVMVDSSSPVAPLQARTEVETVLVGDERSGWVLEVRPDWGWLSDPGRVYPVFVDPSYTFVAGAGQSGSSGDDAFVFSISPAENYNGQDQWDGTHYVDYGGYFGGPGAIFASYLHYDLSFLAGKAVSAATWAGYFYWASAYSTNYRIRPVSSTWLASSVTWNSRPGTVSGQSKTGTVSAANQWKTQTVTSWVQNWVNGTWANHGLVMDATGTTSQMVAMAADESSAHRSYIEVTYNSYPDVPTQLVPPSGSATSDSWPTLSGRVSDPDGGTVRGRFEVWDESATTLLRQGGSLVSSGQVSTYTPSDLVDDTYLWRVRAWDGSLYGSYSGWQTLTVDTEPPEEPGVSSATFPEGAWTSATSGTFSFTDGGSSDVVAWYWGLDVEQPTTYTTASTLQLTPGSGWHTLAVRSTDLAGNLSPVVEYEFGSQYGAVVGFGDGDRTQKRITLGVESAPGYDAAVLIWRRSETANWDFVPLGDLSDAATGQPLPDGQIPLAGGPPQSTADVVWDVASTLGGVDGPFEFAGWFWNGGMYTGATTAVVVGELDQAALGGDYATTAVGPGTVNLVTGDYTISAGDASAGGLGASRSFNSRAPTEPGIFGPGWDSTLAVMGLPYTSLHEETDFVTVTAADGTLLSFRRQADGTYAPEPGAELLTLTRNGARFELSILEYMKVGFTQPVAGGDWVPVDVDLPGTQGASYIDWEVAGNTARPVLMVAAWEPGIDCAASPATTKGCRTLSVEYATATTATGTDEAQWGDYTGQVRRLSYTSWDPATSAMATTSVAEYLYGSDGWLRAAWDPRISPALKVRYGYDPTYGYLASVTPPGEEAWSFVYQPGSGEPAGTGRLRSVSRPALPAGTATTTVVYRIPLTSAAGGPYEMGSGEVGRWAQLWNIPTDAAAVFPPEQTPTGEPPSSYERATVFYADANGRLVNTVAPGGGTTTTQYDEYGNAFFELSAGNRQAALDRGANPAEEAVWAVGYSTWRAYSPEGIDVVDEWGPLHEVTLPDGSRAERRAHTHWVYDEGAPQGGPYHLPTTVTTGAAAFSLFETPPPEVDIRTTRYGYANGGWELGQATTTTVDPDGLNLTTTTLYDDTGRLVERRLPAGPAGGDAHSTLYLYYSAGTHLQNSYCGNKPEYAGLLCIVTPAAQPATPGLPELPYTIHLYDRYDQPSTTYEVVGAWAALRAATHTYDPAGRIVTEAVIASEGTALPTVSYGYDPNTGRLLTTTDGTNTISRAYDSLGRLTAYTDATANTTMYTYDLSSRVASTNDGKGARTISYDQGAERRGLPTSISDSTAGTFTATYDLDGRLVTQTYPGGLTAAYTYDEMGSATGLTYTKDSTTWLDFTVSASVHGQWATHAGSLSNQTYAYDQAGRLVEVHDTPAGAGCSVRVYGFDADTNRTSLTARPPNPDGTCATTGGTVKSYTCDAADRAITAGYAYDSFGRTLSVPAADAPTGQDLSFGYYLDDLAHTVTDPTGTRTFELDPARRQYRWADSADGQTRTNHYAGDSDVPVWTAENTAGTDWTRHITGFTGLAAVQTHTAAGGDAIKLQLANLHGDIIATADPNASIYDTPTLETTEYGAARSGSYPRYGYLGTHQRQNDPSGITLMGVRLYNPTTGRFLSVDPLTGGSANNYDYVAGDPIGGRDIGGTCVCPPDLISSQWRTYRWEPWRYGGWGVPYPAGLPIIWGENAISWWRQDQTKRQYRYVKTNWITDPDNRRWQIRYYAKIEVIKIRHRSYTCSYQWQTGPYCQYPEEMKYGRWEEKPESPRMIRWWHRERRNPCASVCIGPG